MSEDSASSAQQNCMSESYKQRIIEEATIYKGVRRELTEFEKRVNSASAELISAYLISVVNFSRKPGRMRQGIMYLRKVTHDQRFMETLQLKPQSSAMR